MKKFFYFSIITLCLFGCKPIVQENETPIFSVKILQNGELIPVVNDTTIIINDFNVIDEDKIEFRFDGTIFPEEGFTLEVSTARNQFAVENKTTDELCIRVCKGAQEEVYDDDYNVIDTIFPVTAIFDADIKDEQPQTFYAHCSPKVEGDHIITYDFHELGKPNANVKIKVIYRY